MKRYIAIALIASGTTAFAHSGVKDPDVKNRMMGMSNLAKQMKVIGTMARGQADFDAEAVTTALEQMSEEASRIPALFETEATDPKSEALPAIWTNWDRFTARAAELETLTDGLAGTIRTSADLGPAVRQIGKACGACHGDFRAK